MAKVKHHVAAVLLMLLCCLGAVGQYSVHYTILDSAQQKQLPSLQTSFTSQNAASDYLNALTANLRTQGYVTASLDSVRQDSTSAIAALYLGRRYKWAHLRTSPTDEELLQSLRWNRSTFSNVTMDFSKLRDLQTRILNRLEETGYPFAKIYLDSLDIAGGEVSALLKIDHGILYKIDSIRVYGDVDINKYILQKHLDILNGSTYNKKKLLAVDKKLSELQYVQVERPSDLTMLGFGSILNVYLKPKKNNQINALVGFLPNPDVSSGKKFLITGEANLLLRNSLGAGETMGLNWQQLQQKSPRLTIIYEQPYFLRSPFGINFNLEMFKKDTTYLNLLFNLGANYRTGNRIASIFLQHRQTNINGINAAQVLFTRRLPQEADVSSNSVGVGYDINTTDYRFNPRRGNEFVATASTGIKNIRKNNQVLQLKDPNDASYDFAHLYDTVKLRTYQFRAVILAAHYFPLTRSSTIRTALNGGFFSSGNIFRNELFQIGGFKVLRGFDEESEYLSQYAIGTVEYRYLLAQNSNFFVFVDGGWGRQPAPISANRTYISSGLGISFETKAGIFNLAWAVGKRDDTDFNLRKSKVHLGFVGYF